MTLGIDARETLMSESSPRHEDYVRALLVQILYYTVREGSPPLQVAGWALVTYRQSRVQEENALLRPRFEGVVTERAVQIP